MKNLRTFLVKLTDFFYIQMKTYGLFINENLRTFLQIKTYGLFYNEKTYGLFYIKNKIISLEFIPLSTVEEKGAQNNKDVCGIQNNVRGLEKSLR